MEKRVLIAVVLSFLVLYLYQSFLAPPPPKPQPAPAQRPEAGDTSRVAGRGSSRPPSAEQAQAAAPVGPSEPGPASRVGEGAERDIVIESATVRAVFSNRGAHLKSWRLKTYRDDQGEAVDLVPQNHESATRPFMVETGDGDLDARMNTALFKADRMGVIGEEPDGTVTLGFEYGDEGGLSVRKTFTLTPATYMMNVSADVTVNGEPRNVSLALGPGPGDIEKSSGTSYAQKPQGTLFHAGDVVRIDAKSVVTQPVREGEFRWAGVDDQYFMSCALLDGDTARIEYEAVAVPDGAGKTHNFVSYSVNPTGQGASVRFFVGPKDFDLLQSIDPQLVKSVNFGMFAWLAVPLLKALKGINAYIGNYGWSIIVLTFLINLVLFPLRHKSFVSMKKLQALQPEMKAIQDRYGKLKAADPARQKMNQELMELYKQRGVNPASGCVPMLLTMPVLFAFYSLLSVAIEIRGAPFVFWITDLSRHDPWYVTPVMMGATMVLQQRMTPSTADPMQQKMMMLMPIVFTGMFLWAPSGLVIYWFFSNLFAIAQQWGTNRLTAAVPVKAVRPPAERRIKAAQKAGDRRQETE
ncbi:MAG: membrane protein insertase YidC [Acidobacteriota bacterium]